jgi:hypothetical protein
LAELLIMPEEKFPRTSSDYRYFGLSKLERAPHVRRCFVCKLLLSWLETDRDPAHLVRGRDLVIRHVRDYPAGFGHACSLTTCFSHERVPTAIASPLITFQDPEKTYTSCLGRMTTRIDLPMFPLDEAFETKITTRANRSVVRFPPFRPIAGHVFVQLGHRQSWLHLLINPFCKLPGDGPYEIPGGMMAQLQKGTGLMDPQDPMTYLEVLRYVERRFPKLRDHCLEQYKEIRWLAQASEEFEEEGDEFIVP